jgi:hypothetical protein
MPAAPASTAHPFGVAAATAVALLCFVYACVVAIGLLTLPSPDHQIQQPWFTLMEGLIIAIAPAMVVLAAALHTWAPQQRKSVALASVAFSSMCAVLTCVVHFAILTLSRQPAFAEQAWADVVFSFKWPSVAYAIDILAWDVFFPLAALCAAAAIQCPCVAAAARGLLAVSAALAFIGLVGVPLANMQFRNVGIIGYAVTFPLAAAFMVVLSRRGSSESAA